MSRSTSSKRLLARIGILATLAATAICLAACNTVKGAGRDIQNAGEAGERVINGD